MLARFSCEVQSLMVGNFMTLAKEGRNQIVNQWMFQADKQFGLSQAGVAKSLIEEAVKQGFIPEEKTLLGSSLQQYIINKSSPLWLSQTALILLLKNGWVPENDEQWAGYAYVAIRIPESSVTVSILNKIGKEKLSQNWLQAAIDERKAYLKSRGKG